MVLQKELLVPVCLQRRALFKLEVQRERHHCPPDCQTQRYNRFITSVIPRVLGGEATTGTCAHDRGIKLPFALQTVIAATTVDYVPRTAAAPSRDQ